MTKPLRLVHPTGLSGILLRGGVFLLAAFLCALPQSAAASGGLQKRVGELTRSEALSLFVLNCAYFGSWPSEVSPAQSHVLEIGILGGDPFGESLDLLAEKARQAWFREGKINIRRATRPEDLTMCHLIYVGDPAPGGLGRVLSFFKGKPAVLVGEDPEFLITGGDISVRIEDERIVFDMNTDSLEGRGVSFNSRMRSRAAYFLRNGKREPNRYREGNE